VRRKFRNTKQVNDEVYTPDHVAKAIIDAFAPTGKCLDPCMGDGVFLKYLPEGSMWCEISKGRDFFDFDKKVDWIISNPPYSQFVEFTEHAMSISDNVVWLSPIGKVFSSLERIRMFQEYAGADSSGMAIERILLVPAKEAGFPFGFPVGAIHFKRGYTGAMAIKWLFKNDQ
jgi:methylase of polypeptide subunit release factors